MRTPVPLKLAATSAWSFPRLHSQTCFVNSNVSKFNVAAIFSPSSPLKNNPPLGLGAFGKKPLHHAHTALRTAMEGLSAMLTDSPTRNASPRSSCMADSCGMQSIFVPWTDHEMRKERTCSPKQSLAGKWREYHGANNWQGLLDPLDPNLRREIVKYGEFAQATYDAFNSDPHSEFYGNCTSHDMDSFFHSVGLKKTGYKVTKYLYAASSVHLPHWITQLSSAFPDKRSSWMGFVAVSDNEQEIKRLGRRDIVIAWRGTMTPLEWAENLNTVLKPVCAPLKSQNRSTCKGFQPKVESGFLNLYTSKPNDTMKSASEQVMEEVSRLVELYKDDELSITITGHSLGASLALLSAYQIGELAAAVRANRNDISMNDKDNIPVTVFSFAGPRVGNHDFKQSLEDTGVKTLRIVNSHDVIPRIPGILFDEWIHKKCCEIFQEEAGEKMGWLYSHVGTELRIDHLNSPYLKPTADMSGCHNLEAHLHLVDGFESSNSPFRSNAKRDYSLVNKTCNLLRDELMVPPNWLLSSNHPNCADANSTQSNRKLSTI